MNASAKHIASVIFLSSAYITATAQQSHTPQDTIAVVNECARMVITESPSGVKVTTLSHNDGDEERVLFYQDYERDANVTTHQSTTIFKPFDDNIISIGKSNSRGSSKRRHSWDIVSNGIAVGLTNAVGQPRDLGLQWGKSFEISWINTIGVAYSYRSIGISAGIGFTWRNYRMSGGDIRMVPNAEGGITTDSYPDGVRPQSSRIKVFSLGIPLLWNQRLPGGLHLKGGAILNFNTHASLLTKYTDSDGNACSESTNSIHHRRVTVDYFGSLSYRGIGLYTRYSPHNVLLGHGSPQWKPLSVGVVLMM